MSQASYIVPTGGSFSMVAFAGLMNGAYNALASQSSGAAAPANGPGAAPQEFQTWFNTTNVNFPSLNIYDGVNWNRVGTLDVVNSNWLPKMGGGVTTLASASTVDLGSSPQTLIVISGVTTINSFGSNARPGEERKLRFSGSLQLTYNAALIQIPGNTNITTQTDDSCTAIFIGPHWFIHDYVFATNLSSSVQSVANSDGTLTISPTHGSVVASLNLGHANTWTGNITASGTLTASSTLTANGNFIAGNGKPWIDVLSEGADPTGVSDSTTAIQNAINTMNSNFAGGIVYFPPGTYLVSGGGVTVKTGVRLIGAARLATILKVTTDSTVVAFDTSCTYAGIENIFVQGFNNAAATQNAVTVGLNVAVTIKDCHIWFGNAALFTQGVDGLVENCFISGYGSCISSNGANWYLRCKFDTISTTVTYSLFHGDLVGASAPVENHFTECDFSGTFTHSVAIIDNSGTAHSITTFEGCVFSSPVNITKAQATMFSACEFGSTNFSSNGSVIVVGSYAFAATTTGATALAGNVNIS